MIFSEELWVKYLRRSFGRDQVSSHSKHKVNVASNHSLPLIICIDISRRFFIRRLSQDLPVSGENWKPTSSGYPLRGQGVKLLCVSYIQAPLSPSHQVSGKRRVLGTRVAEGHRAKLRWPMQRQEKVVKGWDPFCSLPHTLFSSDSEARD